MKKYQKITADCILAEIFSIPLKYPKRSASTDAIGTVSFRCGYFYTLHFENFQDAKMQKAEL
jgi:hypothetical protein